MDGSPALLARAGTTLVLPFDPERLLARARTFPDCVGTVAGLNVVVDGVCGDGGTGSAVECVERVGEFIASLSFHAEDKLSNVDER